MGKWEASVKGLRLEDRIVSYFKTVQTDAKFSIRFAKKVGEDLKLFLQGDTGDKLNNQDWDCLAQMKNEIADINDKIFDGQGVEKEAFAGENYDWKSRDMAEGNEEMRLFAERNLSIVTRILQPNSRLDAVDVPTDQTAVAVSDVICQPTRSPQWTYHSSRDSNPLDQMTPEQMLAEYRKQNG